MCSPEERSGPPVTTGAVHGQRSRREDPRGARLARRDPLVSRRRPTQSRPACRPASGVPRCRPPCAPIRAHACGLGHRGVGWLRFGLGRVIRSSLRPDFTGQLTPGRGRRMAQERPLDEPAQTTSDRQGDTGALPRPRAISAAMALGPDSQASQGRWPPPCR